jgi:hypothetical protein
MAMLLRDQEEFQKDFDAGFTANQQIDQKNKISVLVKLPPSPCRRGVGGEVKKC